MKNVQEMGKRLQSVRRFFTQTHAITPLPTMMTNALDLSTMPHSAKIPEMPVLKAVAKAGKGLINFEDTAFFSVQHILRTNTPLFKHLIEDFNVNPNNIYLSGKLAQRIQLNSALQYFVAQEFRKCQPADKYSLVQWQLTQDLKWLENNSGGKVQYDAELAHRFSSITCEVSEEETTGKRQTFRTSQLPTAF
ncbi:MAG TPA: hypothetical protein PK583_02180 [Gammaproteobacteria bacterium]|nr:hypothetical protein [Gammaproteobacteria bacterium]